EPNSTGLMAKSEIGYGKLTMLRVIDLIVDLDAPLNLRREAMTFEYIDGSRFEGRCTRDQAFIQVAMLTHSGGQLARSAGGERNEAFFQKCLEYFRANGLELKEATR